jgi:hypothetical protein
VWKLLERQTTSCIYILCLCWCMLLSGLQYSILLGSKSLDGLSEFNGTGPRETLLTISDQDSRRFSYLQLFKWNSDFFEQFCILFSYASIPTQEATTFRGPPEKLDSLSWIPLHTETKTYKKRKVSLLFSCKLCRFSYFFSLNTSTRSTLASSTHVCELINYFWNLHVNE